MCLLMMGFLLGFCNQRVNIYSNMVSYKFDSRIELTLYGFGMFWIMKELSSSRSHVGGVFVGLDTASTSDVSGSASLSHSAAAGHVSGLVA